MKQLYCILVCVIATQALHAQGVGIGTITPDPSAKLEIASDSSGILIPRMTASQRDDIANPATGLVVFVTNDNTFYYYNGANWTTFNRETRELVDTDGDTKVEVERTPDDDLVRIASSSKTVMTMDSSSTTIRGNVHQTPNDPVAVGSFESGPLKAVCVSGSYAYILDNGFNRLWTIDISKPSSPNSVGLCFFGNSELTDLFVSGRYAYVSTQDAHLKIVDISKPSIPDLIGTFSVGSVHTGLYVAGRYVYLVDASDDDLKIIDITDPTNPVVSGALTIGSIPYAVFVQGRYAYVLDHGSDDLKVIDVSDPASPYLAGSLVLGGSPNAVYVSGKYAYVVDDTKLKVIRISNPNSLAGVSSIALGSDASSVFVSGRYAFISMRTGNALKIVDVANPNQLSLVGDLPIDNLPHDVYVSGRYAYVASGAGDLTVVDLSGTEVSSLMAHSLEVGNIQVRNDIIMQGQLQVNAGITIGTGGMSSYGDVGITGNANVAGNLGIGTSTPHEPLEIAGSGRAFFGNDGGEYRKGLLIDGVEGGTASRLEAFDYEEETGMHLLLNAYGGGHVGIGTFTPTKAKVEILGGASHNMSYGYLNGSGSVGTGSGTNSYSLYADQRIAASEFNAHSDARIKQIRGVSDGSRDLETLMDIEIVDYRLIDTVTKGTARHKKVIAQQVAVTYPQAVTNNITEVIPDIYQRAELQDGWIMLPTDLTPGERVMIITEHSREICDVTDAEPTRFKVDGPMTALYSANSAPPKQTVFIYGREVDDFHTVDYEAIAMLNVSATQEQQRLITAQQNTIASQQQMLNEYRGALHNLAERVTALEAKTLSQ